jgi:thiol-disulfide isomerase/thioredoxin
MTGNPAPARRAPRWRWWSIGWLAAIVAVAVGLGVLAFVPLLRGSGTGTEGTLVGKAAPMVSATDLYGRSWTLANGRGRITWVNFWATNCEPCRTEMPAMQRLSEVYGSRLLILGVDWGEERSAVADFARRYAIHYPILLDPTLDNFYRWASRGGLPRHYFVDGNGTVVREIIGPLDPTRMATILAELLGPPSS